jgi:hypothetical protein
VKATRAQVLGTLLIALAFFAFLIVRYAHLFNS